MQHMQQQLLGLWWLCRYVMQRLQLKDHVHAEAGTAAVLVLALQWQ